MSESFTFEIVSPRYGKFEVTAPARFRTEIEAHHWHVSRDPKRVEGCQFLAATNVPTAEGRTKLTLHRLVWRLLERPKTHTVDHVDGQPLNNAETNLRAATSAQNSQNHRKLKTTNKSGVRGVCWSVRESKWNAQIGIERRVINLGYYADLEEAIRVRDAAALKYHGQYAVLNQEGTQNV